MTPVTDTLGGPFCLAVAAFTAPLVAVDPLDPAVLHAATMEAIVDGWDKDWIRSACFQAECKLFVAGGESVPWPPRVVGLADLGRSRCVACHNATGRRRPRCTITRVPGEADETVLRWGTP